MPDGEYRLGHHTVHKCANGVRLPDGTLAGSLLTMDAALRNLVDEVGLNLQDASRQGSTFAADPLVLHDCGRLTAAAWADVVILNSQLDVEQVCVKGDMVRRPSEGDV